MKKTVILGGLLAFLYLSFLFSGHPSAEHRRFKAGGVSQKKQQVANSTKKENTSQEERQTDAGATREIPWARHDTSAPVRGTPVPAATSSTVEQEQGSTGGYLAQQQVRLLVERFEDIRQGEAERPDDYAELKASFLDLALPLSDNDAEDGCSESICRFSIALQDSKPLHELSLQIDAAMQQSRFSEHPRAWRLLRTPDAGVQLFVMEPALM